MPRSGGAACANRIEGMDAHRLAAFNTILGWLEAEEQAAHDRMNQVRFVIAVLKELRDRESETEQEGGADR